MHDRYANLSVGIQEKLVLQRKAQQAMERGEPVPDLPGMQEALDDKDLMRKKEEIAAKNKSLMRGSKETELQKKGSRWISWAYAVALTLFLPRISEKYCSWSQIRGIRYSQAFHVQQQKKG